MPRYTHLTLREKASIGRALLAAMTRRDRDETFEAWLERNHQGAGERRAFWDPFFIPALNAPFDRVGAPDAMFVLRTAFLKDPAAARFGFSEVPLAHLAAAAAQSLDAVHLSTAVISIEPKDDSVTLRTPEEALDFDAVVLAVPPRQVERMLGDAARYEIANLDAYDPYPIIDVHLWHDGGSIGIDFAAALESPLQWIFEKKPGYLCCSFSSAEEYVKKPTGDLEALAWSETQAFLPELKDAKLVRSAVTRNPEATWLPKIHRARTKQRTSHPRLAIAGAWTDTGWPDTMESAVRSGKIAAALITATASHEPFDVLSDRSLAPAEVDRAPQQDAEGARQSPGGERHPSQSSEFEKQTHVALGRAVDWLLYQQNEEGWWSGELETNVTMTAEHVLLFKFLGLPVDGFRYRRDRAYSQPSARRRIVGAVLRRAGRSEHHDRSVRGAQSARRRSVARRNAPRARGDSQGGRCRQGARLHEDLACALRHLSVVGRALAAARDRLLSACGCRSISMISRAGLAGRLRR